MSATQNWTELRHRPSTSPVGVPEYDPSEVFVLTKKQAGEESRRVWSDNLSSMAGSPVNRKRSGTIGFNAMQMAAAKQLPAITSFVPRVTERGKKMVESTHWRTGQKTMLDQHMMKMYVVGVQ